MTRFGNAVCIRGNTIANVNHSMYASSSQCSSKIKLRPRHEVPLNYILIRLKVWTKTIFSSTFKEALLLSLEDL
jgi:hypothetical protein